MFAVLVASAQAGKVVPPEGTYAAGPVVYTVGKKAKTLGRDDAAPEAAKLVAPGLLSTASGFQPFAVSGDRVWFADVVLDGAELVTVAGAWFHREGDTFVPRNDAAEGGASTAEVLDGVVTVDGWPLLARGPGLSTSPAVPAVRGATAADARKAVRDVFVDPTIATSMAAAQGVWPSPDGDGLRALAGGRWADAWGSAAALPLSPCGVELVGEDGSVRPLGFWSDGIRARTGRVAVTAGDAVWACDDDTLMRWVGDGACESWRYTAADGDTPAVWDPLGGCDEQPPGSGGSYEATGQPGVFGGLLQERVDPALVERVKPPADLRDELRGPDGEELADEGYATAVGEVRSAIAGCFADRRFEGTLVLFNPFDDPTAFWSAKPKTPDGVALEECVKGAVGSVTVKRWAPFRVSTPEPPERAAVTVKPTSEGVPAPIVALVTDAVAICTAVYPITGPYSRSFQPEGQYVLGATMSMAEGQVQPSMDHIGCVDFHVGDLPAGSAFMFDIAPGGAP